ncbi:MAG: hypothetical protein WD048_10270 [Chitinophagales bacterium]
MKADQTGLDIGLPEDIGDMVLADAGLFCYFFLVIPVFSIVRLTFPQ